MYPGSGHRRFGYHAWGTFCVLVSMISSPRQRPTTDMAVFIYFDSLA